MPRPLLKTETLHPPRCTIEQKVQIQRNALEAGMTVSDFLVQRALYQECPPVASLAAAVKRPPLRRPGRRARAA